MWAGFLNRSKAELVSILLSLARAGLCSPNKWIVHLRLGFIPFNGDEEIGLLRFAGRTSEQMADLLLLLPFTSLFSMYNFDHEDCLSSQA